MLRPNLEILNCCILRFQARDHIVNATSTTASLRANSSSPQLLNRKATDFYLTLQVLTPTVDKFSAFALW